MVLTFTYSLSEFQLARPSDSHRKEMLFGSLAKPGHPMSKFCWGTIHLQLLTEGLRFSGVQTLTCVCPAGNAQTLKHEPREKHINTYQRLRDFWGKYYSAQYMTLAVQSKGDSHRRPCLLTLSNVLLNQIRSC